MKVLTGDEPLKFHNESVEKTISDFWKWNSSDLLNNTLRGVFAEFIVATALGIDLTHAREDWAAYDLCGREGERIEVKSSGYLQSFHPANQPEKLSKIIFSISPALEWLSDECCYKPDSYSRHSDVYIFCHYKCMVRSPENPLNLDNWGFYVLATYKINNIFGKQKSVSLDSLLKRGNPIRCDYEGIRAAIAKEYADHLGNKRLKSE